MKTKSLVGALIIGSLMMSMMVSPAFAQSNKIFDDVNETDLNHKAIEYLKNKDVVEGYANGDFKPDSHINRAEFLKIVMEAKGYTSGGSYCYSDVKNEWFAPYICAASNLGIVAGYSDGKFRPEQNINVAEATKIVVQSFALDISNADNDSWFHKYVAALDLLNAIPTTFDRFDKLVTRGEMAEIVWRIDDGRKTEHSISYHELKELDDSKLLSISLSAYGNGQVNWENNGRAHNGVKVVWSKKTDPTYPTRTEDKSKFLDKSGDGSASLDGFDGAGTYFVRVCEYTGDGCGIYSNQIEVELVGKDENTVEDIDLVNLGNNEVRFIVDGVATKGIKVVWSKNSNPSYPVESGTEYKYVNESTNSTVTLSAFDGAGTYHVRACAYTGDGCGVYSDDITVDLD